jgi:hypothetical protein
VKVKNQIKLYQVHLTTSESQKSDKVVSSTHRWWGVLDTTLSDFWLFPMVRCTWYNFIWFLTLTGGEVYLIQLYLIFDSHRWWGVLDTTVSDFWLPPMIKYTSPSVRLKNKIKLYQVHLTIGESQKSDKVVSSTEVYLIELYLIFDFHRWWGVLDTTLSDFWLSPVVRCTWYNFIWVVSSTPHHRWESKIRSSSIKYTAPSVKVKNQIKLYQVHVTIGETQKSDKVVSSTPHHQWESKIR